MPPAARAAANLDALLESVAREMDALPAAAARGILPVLAEAERELARALADVLGTDAAAAYTAQAHRNALVQVRGAIDALAARAPDVAAELARGGRAAAVMATRHVRQELVQFSLRFDHTIRPVPIVPAASIVARETARMSHYATSARRYTGAVGMRIRAQLAVGLVRGESVGQLAKRLVRLAHPVDAATLRALRGPIEPASFVEDAARGLMQSARSKALVLVRTEVISAYNLAAIDGIHEAAQDDDQLLVRWDAALDRRVCPYCEALDGRTVRPGTLFRSPLGDVAAPPLHPNCRCAAVAWSQRWQVPQRPGTPAPGDLHAGQRAA